ncbi:MAG: hypothetical protein ACTSRZ_18425 [Promethearchaeota archaeon]
MSQSIFQKMQNSLDEIIQGRKLLISTMEKLRKDVPNLAPYLEKLSDGIKNLEAFGVIASQVKDRLDGMQAGITSINNMAVALENLKGEIHNLNNNYLTYKPILEAIKQSTERQEQTLIALSQQMQQLASLMGTILARLGG